MRPLLDTALDAVVAMRVDGTIAEWNRAAETIFGWKREEALGRTMAELIIPPAYRAAHEKGLARYLKTGEAKVLDKRIEISAVDRSERQFPVELSISFTEIGSERLFVGFIRDISDRKRAEELLVRQANEAQLLFSITQFAAQSSSFEPVLERTLEAICKLTGWPVGHAFIVSPDDPTALVSTDIWHGRDHAGFKALRTATQTHHFGIGIGLPGIILQSGEPTWMSNTQHEKAFVRKNVGYRAAFGFPVKIAGQIVAVLEFFTIDQTPLDEELMLTVRTLGEQVGRVLERSRAVAELSELNATLERRVADRTRDLESANAALHQSQKMEAIGQLTGGIAHDFNNLLTIIRGSADLLLRSDLTEEKRQRYLVAISDTAERASKLTNQLLAFARRQSLSPENFDVGARLSRIADMLRTILGARTRLVTEVATDGCFIRADIAQFETALVNLAINARDAMDGEGEIGLSVTRQSNGSGTVVLVSVSDNGHGIAADQLDHIFEPFFTTKEVGKGTGLGLSQVYGFVKQSDGDIAVKSEVGKGTCFTLSFPLADPPVETDDAGVEPGGNVQHGRRVLVVEDNPEIGDFACHLLSELGFEAQHAENADAALAILEAGEKRFDVLFTDVVMPGMNGLDLARAVRARWPDMQLLLTSGYSEALAAESDEGFPLLRKPYSGEELAHIIKTTGLATR